MYLAVGEKTKIRNLTREDVEKMQLWKNHREPLFFHYNFPKMTKEEGDTWYKIKTAKWQRKSFAIENIEKEIIGYLLIRDIQWIWRDSELGIVLNPAYINQGYGTDALQSFLEYYFKKMNMVSIHLRTAKYNERGKRCYEKCGFKSIMEKDFPFEDQYAEIFHKECYPQAQEIFTYVDGVAMTRYIIMKMTKKDYFQKVEGLSTKIMLKCE
ncbi:MAG: GNAT family N-acetyltransferase [Thermotaleaceae bacterium]